MATLMLEILLTRIFSVTMWYHFAFMAISIGMFGMTVGSLIVYLKADWFRPDRVHYHLGWNALLFALSIVFSFLAHLCIPFIQETSLVAVFSLGLTYAIIAVPFVFSGICICLALTKMTNGGGQVGKLYAADLAGAATGCILLIVLLDATTDAASTVVLVAVFAGLASVAFLKDRGHRRLLNASLATSILLAIFALVSIHQADKQSRLLPLIWVKGNREPPNLYEGWNSFSRVIAGGDPARPQNPFIYGRSPAYRLKADTRQLFINIDAGGGTGMTRYDGNPEQIDFLKHDLVHIVHYLRPDARVLIIGAGGGRDVLAALAFDQKSVVAVELNPLILQLVNVGFGDFTGHLDRNPRVKFVNDEARSYIARQKESYDVIQASFIDTWAATAAGAWVLAENSLYTVDAWKIFLSHLSEKGILTYSRWYYRDRPAEIYRIVSLASEALRQCGAEDPRRHLALVRLMESNGPTGLGTILVSKAPFSEHDLDLLEETARKLRYEIAFSPRASIDPMFDSLSGKGRPVNIYSSYDLNVKPPTDDSPFFFNMLRFGDVFNAPLWRENFATFNLRGVFVLEVLLAIVAALTISCIGIPLLITTEKSLLKGSSSFLVYFAMIGFGFMFIEISQIQRLSVFLGHPTYALSVALFTLLLSSGLGSYLTKSPITPFGWIRWSLLLVSLLLFGAITPSVTAAFQASTTPVRLAVSIILLFPLGVFMGMPFPAGMSHAARKAPLLTPWFWGVNGATSVCGSVLAIAIALGSGISTSYWVGFLCYFCAFAAYCRESLRGNR